MFQHILSARQMAGLFIAGLIAVAPVAAQDKPLIPASVADATRVHTTFLTMGMLMRHCAVTTGDLASYEAGLSDWETRNADDRDLADVVLKFLKAELDLEALKPKAEADVSALLNSLVTQRELCARFLTQIPAGELDLSTLVPDLQQRLVQSVVMIAGGAVPN
jgi:hypothetical protein